MAIGGDFGVVLLALWIYSLFEVIVADQRTVRVLPKLAWVMIVLFGGPFGAAAWFFLGRRPRCAGTSCQSPASTSSPAPPPTPPRRRPLGPEDSPEFMAALERKRREQERNRRRRDGGLNGAGSPPSE